MCGRYVFASEENEFLQKLIEKAKKAMTPDAFERLSLFDVFPSQQALVMAAGTAEGTFRMIPMTWGYAGRGSQLIINARSETAFEEHSFFAKSIPCAIPASAYYEWSPDRRKYSFRLEDPFFLGGLCRMENGEPHFVILTEPAAQPQNRIHNRQPLLFTSEDAKAWVSSRQPTHLVSRSVQKRIIQKA